MPEPGRADIAPFRLEVLLPAPRATVPRNVAPLLRGFGPQDVRLRGPSGLVETTARTMIAGLVRMVPRAPLADGPHQLEQSLDGATQVLVQFEVGQEADQTPPAAPEITEAIFREPDFDCGQPLFDVRARAAADQGSPADSLVHELFVAAAPEGFGDTPVEIALAPPPRWTLFHGPSGKALELGQVFYVRARARDLADNPGAWSVTWRLVVE